MEKTTASQTHFGFTNVGSNIHCLWVTAFFLLVSYSSFDSLKSGFGDLHPSIHSNIVQQGFLKKCPRCHEIIDPEMDHTFDELSNGVWHLIHSGNLDSENPNNWRFDWLLWPLAHRPIHHCPLNTIQIHA